MQEELKNKIKLSDKTNDDYMKKPSKYDFSKFSSLEEFAWDEDLASKLEPLAQKLNLTQDSVEMLLEIALEMAQKQKSYYEKDEKTKYEQKVLAYSELFNQDMEVPKVNTSQIKTYMTIANGAYSDFASLKLKEILTQTGLVYHPEVIKLFYKIGELSQEDNLSHYGAPSVEELTPAQILYGTKD